MKYILSFLFLALFIQGCQEKIADYKPEGQEPKLVVDATISDSTSLHFVKLSMSVDLLSSKIPPAVNDAQVIVKDNTLNLIDTFKLESGNNGIYLPSKVWKGIPGNSYSIKIVTTTKTVNATEVMPNWSNFSIDSLRPVFREEATSQRVENKSYNDYFFGKQYINRGDSVYRIRVYGFVNIPYRVNIQMLIFRNSSEFYTRGYLINNINEVPINSFYIFPPSGDGPPTSTNYLLNDTVTVVLKGITNECFDYYRSLNAVLNSDGGLFNSPPGNPVNNFNDKEVFGYFRTVRLTSKTVVISKANRKLSE